MPKTSKIVVNMGAIDHAADGNGDAVSPIYLGEAFAKKVLTIVDAGLVNGLGVREPGKMCVEAAVAFAAGEDHNDRPSCVHHDLAEIKINLNDEGCWGSAADRAKGLRRLAIAQLGSKDRFKTIRFTMLFADRAGKILLKVAHNQAASVINELDFNLDHPKVESVRDLLDVGTGAAKKAMLAKLGKMKAKAFGLGRCYYPGDLIDELRALNVDQIEASHLAAEVAVQVLKDMKIPGTKYLYLTETKSKTKARNKK